MASSLRARSPTSSATMSPSRTQARESSRGSATRSHWSASAAEVYSFAARPRWVVLHVLLLIVVGLFALAGIWQLHRLSDRRERNAFVLSRRSQPVVALERFNDDPEAA